MAFGGGEIKDVLIRLTGDSSSLKQANKDAERSFTELNQAVELTKTAVQAVSATFGAAMGVISRGQGVSEISAAFSNLQQQFGTLASNELPALQKATGGLISNLDLMRAANESMLAGIDPSTFLELAGAADSLGDAVGLGAKEALDALTKSIALGDERALKLLRITVDNDKAFQAYAKTLGTTADKLSESGKQEALRLATIEKLRETLPKLGSGAETAGDGMDRVSTAISNYIDKVAQAINESPELADSFSRLADNISNIDPQPIAEIAVELANIAALSFNAVNAFLENFQKYREGARRGFLILTGKEGGDLQDDLDRATLALKSTTDEIDKLKASAGSAGTAVADLSKFVFTLGAMKSSKERLKELNAELPELQKRFNDLASAQGATGRATKEITEMTGAMAGMIDVTNGLGVNIGQTAVVIKRSTAGHVDHNKALDEAAKKAEELAKKKKQLADAFESSQISLQNDILGDSLKNAIDGIALGKGAGGFDALLEQFRKSTKEGILKGYEETIKTGAITQEEAEKDAELRTERAANVYLEAQIEANQKAADDLKQKFDASVEFFSDLLTPMFEGEAANFEDIFKDAAKRVAIGFAAQMAAAVAAEWGLAGVGNITSAGGLGQSIAASLGFEGGGVSKLTDLLKDSPLTASAVALDGSAAALTSAAAALAASASSQTASSFLSEASSNADLISSLYSSIPGFGTGSAPGMPEIVSVGGAAPVPAGFSFGPMATAGIYAGGAYGAYTLGQNLFDNKKDPGGGAASGALAGAAVGTYILPGIGTVIGAGAGALAGLAVGLTGGDGKKAAEREAREKILDQLFNGDLGVQTVQGMFNLNPNSVNSAAIGVGPKDIGLANPLAMLASGGDDKMQGDLANIFAEAINQADNFNESIVNTLSLMDKLGLDATEAKDELAALFLDGKITLDEFSAGVANMNILAQENLTGPNSIADAFRILAKNIDGDPRLALKGLELGFKEMAEIGIDTQDEILAYVTDNFGPEFASVFNSLAAVGIDSFEDLGAIGPDALAGIFNALNPVKDSLADFFGLIKAGDEGADMTNTEQGLKRVEAQAKKTNEEFKKGIELQKQYAQALNNNNGGLNGNPL